MNRQLVTDGRNLAKTNLTSAKRVSCDHHGVIMEIDVPEGLKSISVMNRIDGKWYAEAKSWAGVGETQCEAVRSAFRVVRLEGLCDET